MKHYNEVMMLHIVNGDETLAILKKSSITGDFLVWKEMLMEGPVHPAPSKIKSSNAKGDKKKETLSKKIETGDLDWKIRAKYLQENFGIDSKGYLKQIENFFKIYSKAITKKVRGNAQVTFWFEEDFFCQIHLIYFLAHLPAELKRKGRCFIICPEKPLGIRLPNGLEKLYTEKIPLEAVQIAIAKNVWKAFAKATPKGWEGLLKWALTGKGFAAWPHLQKGLRAYLGLRSNPNGGLNAIQKAVVKSVATGPMGFAQFYRRLISEQEIRPLGLGNLQVSKYVLDFANQSNPLIAIEGPGSKWKPGNKIKSDSWVLKPTAFGKSLA